ncbi:hypothetical protein D5F01_LYC07774 [Larimichthys crocea]|uniref:Uncharacterized protein n=1 Tax=Larimichthys crocea TaxID=215358 RepID=A0A6G0IMD9_LARCR|nr:hypothetical protein D5F01_LYC07774 [Larimichthys crocea]
MDLPFEMDSSTISGSINDQPTSTHNHDGLLVEECCQSVFAAPDSSTSDHESPHLKAGISESESSEKLLSFHYGSDKKHSSSSDANDEDEDDLFSNSGSGEEYQPSSTPSSSDSEKFSEKEKKSSRHTIPEKDHCHQSSSEHEELEAMDLRTKDTSPHPFEKRKGGKKGGKKQQGGDKRQKITVNTSQKNGKRTWNKPQYCVYCGKSNLKIARHLQRKHKDEDDVAHAISFPVGSKERKVLLETLRNKGNWQHNLKVLEEGNGEIVTWKRPSEKTPVAKIGKLLFAMEQGAKSLKGKSLKTLDSVVFDERHDRPPTTGSRRGEEGQTSGADRPLEVTDDGDLQHLSTPSSPVERPKKTATRRRHDDNARSESDVDEEESQQQTPERPPVDWSDDERGDEEQSITATKSSAKKRKKTAATATAERGKTGGKQQPMMNTPPPVKRRKKTSTKQKHDADSEEEEQSITSTQSSAKEGQKTAAERGKTGKVLHRLTLSHFKPINCSGNLYDQTVTQTSNPPAKSCSSALTLVGQGAEAALS